jgi:hypothetical protein
MANRTGQTDKEVMATPKRMGLIKEAIYPQPPAQRALGAEQPTRRERRSCPIDPVVLANLEVRTRPQLRRSAGQRLSQASHLRASQERAVRC